MNETRPAAGRIRSSVFEARRKAWTIAIAIIAVSVMDLGAGTLYRVVTGYPWIDSAQRIAEIREREYRQFSPVFHHGLRENVTVKRATWGNRVYEINTNSLGFKSRSIRTVDLVSNKHRLLFIGDSFTEGIGVEYSNTFVGIVEEKLTPEDVEVLNAAASSYSPIIHWRKIKYLLEDVGLRFDEVIVYLDITDPADEVWRYRLGENENVVDRSPPRTSSQEERSALSSFKTAIRNNTILICALYAALRSAIRAVQDETETAGEDLLTLDSNLWTVHEGLFRSWGHEGLQLMTLYMGKLLSVLDENKIRLTVAVYPSPQQIKSGDLNSIQVTYWKSWCEANGVTFINHFPSFFDPSKKTEDIIGRYFIPGDTHWNENGHRLIAEVFLAQRNQSQGR